MRRALWAVALVLAACGGEQAAAPLPEGLVDDALADCVAGDLDRGIGALERTVEGAPGSAEALTALGLCLWTRAEGEDDPADAERAYDLLTRAVRQAERGAVAGPSADEIYSHRAFVARTLDDGWDRTLADLTVAVDLAPQRPAHRLDRAVAYAAAGDTTAALGDLRRARALLGPDDADRQAVLDRFETDLQAD